MREIERSRESSRVQEFNTERGRGMDRARVYESERAKRESESEHQTKKRHHKPVTNEF